MRILITGKNGYIGSSLVTKFSKPGNTVVGIGREDFDLTNRELTNSFFSNSPHFDVVIHTAVKGLQYKFQVQWKGPSYAL